MVAEPKLESGIYVGHVEHDRYTPRRNRFQYRIHHLYLDLDELPSLFERHPLWSFEKRNIVSFRRSDYIGDESIPLKQAVLDRVEEELGFRPGGPVRLLTHPRYFGYVFNPVSFYYCFDPSGDQLEAVVSEITNTPWLERHSYVTDQRGKSSADDLTHNRFDKCFHVSPFFKMDHIYDWGFSKPEDDLNVWMQNFTGGKKVFEARLVGRRLEWNRKNMNSVLLRNPCVTLAGWLAIYWQAAKLRLKGVPYVPHPDTVPSDKVPSDTAPEEPKDQEQLDQEQIDQEKAELK
ncbi:MAG: hypothetical protein CBC13_09195 [Planctomycetia bacterium TMED53]|nr:MAG: hypothetical protein CBC13_09195 [Planctomycetia bacterium TMED53]